MWVPNSNNLRSYVTGPLNKHESALTIRNTRSNNMWYLRKISLNILTEIHQKITSIIFSPEGNKDTIIWDISNKGNFSTISYYDLIDKDPPISKNFKWIWEIHHPNKIKYFLWLSYHNRLPCRYHITRIGMNINNLCTIYCNEAEEIIHIFWGCSVVKNLWQQVGMDIKSHHPNKDN